MLRCVCSRSHGQPLEDVAGKLKYVDPQSDLVREAKALGISFGDE